MKTAIAKAALICAGLLSTQAQAIVVAANLNVASVVDTVTMVSASTWKYTSTLTSQYIVGGSYMSSTYIISDYYLPYFSDAGISGLSAPFGWTVAIESEDRFELGSGAGVLHWSTTDPSTYGAHPCSAAGFGPYTLSDCLTAANTLSGFGFTAAYAPVKGPFQTVDVGGFSLVGDPAVPGSPLAQAAGLNTPIVVSTVPEPSVLTLGVLGALTLLVVGRKRRAQEQAA